MKNRYVLTPALMTVALACMTGAAHAADWHVISTDRGKSIEIDRDSVLRAESGKKVAWGRLVLSEARCRENGLRDGAGAEPLRLPEPEVRHHQAGLSGCQQKILREERAGSDTEIALLPGTLDEKLFREVCQPPGAEELRQVAEQAGRAARTAANASGGMDAQGGRIERTEMLSIKPDLREAAAQAREELSKGAEGRRRAAPEKPALDKHAADKLAGKGCGCEIRRTGSQKTGCAGTGRGGQVRRPPGAVKYRCRRRHPGAAETRADGGAVAACPCVCQAHRRGRLLPKPPVHAHKDIHWSYEGEFGPQNWGRLKPEWAQCAEGRTQSPIDIREGIKVDLPAITFDYKTTYFTSSTTGTPCR
jgi:carbonic anhydrase